MKKGLLLIVILTLINCNKEDNETLFYTMEADRGRHSNWNDSLPPPPPPPPLFLETYYSKHNIVIDSLGDLYYFKHKNIMGWVCGTGLVPDEIYPATCISLYPKDLIPVPKNEPERFVRLNITDTLKSDDKVYIMVGSARDSFYSPELSKIALIIDKYKNGRIIIRRTTEEEEVVLDYKKKKRPYDPKLIQWDSKRTQIQYQFR